MTTFSYSDYLTLTNETLSELNEVNLTTINFAGAVGFQAVAKNAVNRAIRDINSYQYEWPFNHVATSQILTPGTPAYNLPTNCKTVDWDTFTIRQDLNLSSPQNSIYLPQLSYDDYIQRYKPNDENTDSSGWSVPRNIVRNQGSQFVVTPYPDQAYTIDYEYWVSTAALVNYNDLSPVPDLWNHVILNGSMYYCYRFRENLEAAGSAEDKFKENLKYMRYLYITDYLALTDNRAGPQYQMRG